MSLYTLIIGACVFLSDSIMVHPMHIGTVVKKIFSPLLQDGLIETKFKNLYGCCVSVVAVPNFKKENEEEKNGGQTKRKIVWMS